MPDSLAYAQVTQQCAISQDDTSFTVDPTTCQFFDLYQPGVLNTTFWWDRLQQTPTIMSKRPTNCDRDYERLRGFPACAPTPGQSKYPPDTGTANILVSSSTTGTLQYDQYARTYSAPDRSTIRMAKMPYSNATSLGFLGLGPGTTLQGAYESCALVSQCYPAPFTVNGVKATRYLSSGQQVRSPPSRWFTCA